MSHDNYKDTDTSRKVVRTLAFKITIEEITEEPIRVRSAKYVESKDAYTVGDWHDDRERKTEKIFEQVVDDLDLPAVVRAINGM